MDFDRIVIKENKETVDTVSRLEFKQWVFLHNCYSPPPHIKSLASYRRIRKNAIECESDFKINK